MSLTMVADSASSRKIYGHQTTCSITYFKILRLNATLLVEWKSVCLTSGSTTRTSLIQFGWATTRGARMRSLESLLMVITLASTLPAINSWTTLAWMVWWRLEAWRRSWRSKKIKSLRTSVASWLNLIQTRRVKFWDKFLLSSGTMS